MESLRALGSGVAVAVSSFVGFEVGMVDHGHTVTVSAFSPGTEAADIASSL